MKLALSTWTDGITHVVHYSESKASRENNDKLKPQAHLDDINAIPNTFGLNVDIIIESKAN